MVSTNRPRPRNVGDSASACEDDSGRRSRSAWPAAHRVLELGRNFTSGSPPSHRDPPGVRLGVQDLLELLPELIALGDHLGEVVPPDRLTQSGLAEVTASKYAETPGSLPGVPHGPKTMAFHVTGTCSASRRTRRYVVTRSRWSTMCETLSTTQMRNGPGPFRH